MDNDYFKIIRLFLFAPFGTQMMIYFRGCPELELIGFVLFTGGIITLAQEIIPAIWPMNQKPKT